MDHMMNRIMERLGFDPCDDISLIKCFFLCGYVNGLAKQSQHTYKEIIKDSLEGILERYSWISNDRIRVCENSESLAALCEHLSKNDLYILSVFCKSISPYMLSMPELFQGFVQQLNTRQQIKLLRRILEYGSGKTLAETVIIDKHGEEDFVSFLKGLKFDPGFSATELFDAVYCWNISPVKVKTSGNLSKAIDAYRKQKRPMRVLLSDYCDLQKYPKAERALDPWAYVKTAKGESYEKGVSIAETLFEQSAFLIRNELPTDVIRSLFYSPTRNDSGFECGLLLKELSRIIFPGCNVLIVNPSPDMLLHYFEEAGKVVGFTQIVVTDETLAFLYGKQFKTQRASFSPIEKISSLGKKYHAALFTARDYPIENLREAFSAMLQGAEENAHYIAELPHTAFDRKELQYIESITRCGFFVERLLTIHPKATKSIPRKKVLIHLAKSTEENPLTAVYQTFSDGKRIAVEKHHLLVSKEDLFQSHRTLVKAIYEIRNNKTEPGSRRNAPSEYLFSQEIKLLYTIQENRKNRWGGKAYFCEILPPESKRKHGKRLTEIIEKGLRAKTKERVVAQLEFVPFQEEVAAEIRKEIKRYYDGSFETLSLKTIWFLSRESLLKRRIYDDDLAKAIFCNGSMPSSQLFPSTASDTSYEEMMNCVLREDPNLSEIKCWTLLNVIMKCAVEERFIRTNPVANLIGKYSARATQAQLEVRNALAKRSFTHEEEERILAFLFEKIEKDIGGNSVTRFESESIWLVGAIRFFTGMSLREVCALKWSDFKELGSLGTFQLWVTKAINPEGTATNHSEKEDWLRYRRVPVGAALAGMLLQRKKYLLTLGFSEKHILKMPIVLEDESMLDRDERKNVLYCRIRAAAAKCRELINEAQIPTKFLLLPDAETGTFKETDINRYAGDIFQSNFKYHMNHTCGFTRGEANYILGLTAPDTFSKHYCDYTNDFVQYGMAKKMSRWTCRFKVFNNAVNEPSYSRQTLKTGAKWALGPFNGGNTMAEWTFFMPPKEECESIELTVLSEHGCKVEVTHYEKSGIE